MKRSLKIFFIVLVFFISLIALGIYGIYGLYRLSLGICDNQVFQEAFVPGNKFKAVLFQRDCGATTGFSTQISLMKPNAKPPIGYGNIFIAKGHPEYTKLEMIWLTPTRLLIKHTAGLQPNVKETSYKGIAIIYE